MTFHIRQISTLDPEYAQVWALREAVLRQPIGLSLHDEDLSGEVNEHILVAMQHDNVVGCLLLRPVNTRELKARQMAVAGAEQGNGLGAALMREAEALAVSGGYTLITLHARETAVPFYDRLGYKGVGSGFTEVGIPHLLMQKQVA